MKSFGIKKINRNIALASVTLLTVASLGSVGTVLAGTNVGTNTNTGKVVVNAQQAAPQMTNDGTQTGNANIGQTGGQGNASGTTNDGSTVSSGLTPNTDNMANVTFSLQLITATDNNIAHLQAPTYLSSSDSTLTGGSDYTLSGTKYQATTNASGVAEFDQVPDGYYLVQQVTKVGGVYEIQPFIVNIVNGNTVNIYPKMDLANASSSTGSIGVTNAKDTVTNIYNNKTSEKDSAKTSPTGVNPDTDFSDLTDLNTEDDSNTTTAGAGDNVNFNDNTAFDGSQTVTNNTSTLTNIDTTAGTATANNGDTLVQVDQNGKTLPSNVYYDGTNKVYYIENSDGTETVTGSYSIADTLPSNVTLKDGATSGDVTSDVLIPSVVDTSGTTIPLTGTDQLTPATDYYATDDNGVITITLTPTGQQKVADALGTTTTSGNNLSGMLNVQVETVVPDGAVGVGTNTVTSTITNAYTTDLSSTQQTSTLNVGGLDITKTDGSAAITNATIPAKFVLVKALNYADAVNLVKQNASQFTNNIPTSQITVTNTDGTTSQLVLGATSTLTASSATTDGQADTTAATPVVGTLDANGHITFKGLDLSDATSATAVSVNGTSNTDNYFAVEVQAPVGSDGTKYQLPSPTTGANVFGNTDAMNVNTTPDYTDNSIVNVKPFNLPFTGGEGILAVLVIAGVATGAAIVIRKRRNNEDEKA